MLIGRALSAASRRWSAAVTVGVVDVDFLRDFRLLDNQGIQTHNDDNVDDDDGWFLAVEDFWKFDGQILQAGWWL